MVHLVSCWTKYVIFYNITDTSYFVDIFSTIFWFCTETKQISIDFKLCFITNIHINIHSYIKKKKFTNFPLKYISSHKIWFVQEQHFTHLKK